MRCSYARSPAILSRRDIPTSVYAAPKTFHAELLRRAWVLECRPETLDSRSGLTNISGGLYDSLCKLDVCLDVRRNAVRADRAAAGGADDACGRHRGGTERAHESAESGARTHGRRDMHRDH